MIRIVLSIVWASCKNNGFFMIKPSESKNSAHRNFIQHYEKWSYLSYCSQNCEICIKNTMTEVSLQNNELASDCPTVCTLDVTFPVCLLDCSRTFHFSVLDCSRTFHFSVLDCSRTFHFSVLDCSRTFHRTLLSLSLSPVVLHGHSGHGDGHVTVALLQGMATRTDTYTCPCTPSGPCSPSPHRCCPCSGSFWCQLGVHHGGLCLGDGTSGQSLSQVCCRSRDPVVHCNTTQLNNT